MKPISPKPIFTLSFLNPKSINNSHFLSFFSTQTHHHHHQGPVSNYPTRRHDDESRSVRVSVWWDFENCNLPNNANVFRVAQCVTNAVRANGIRGPIQITAFGDVMQISRTNQEALSATGIGLTHVPSGGKNSADRSLLVDLMYWVSQNPPPAHLFLISGDRDFAGILHRLRMSNYNILLASPDSAPSVLCSAATLMWQWSSLLKGENLNGKLFNQPPDGPYGSWYGYYKAPIEDPYAVTEQPSCLPADKSSELAPDSSLRPIPKAVMKQIRHILHSFPEGISITHLRAELSKNKVIIDKELYGYKKFSRFLGAMPQILKLHSGNDGHYIVRGVSSKIDDEPVPALYMEPGNNNGEYGVPKSYSERSSSEDVTEKVGVVIPEAKTRSEQNESTTSLYARDTEVKANAVKLKSPEAKLLGAQKEERKNVSFSPVQKIKARASETNLQEPMKRENLKAPPPRRNMQETPEQGKNLEVVTPLVEIKGSSDATAQHAAVAELGIFKRIWKILFGSEAESISPAWFSPSSHEALIDGNIARDAHTVIELSSQDSSVQNSPNSDNRMEKTCVDQTKLDSKKPEFFAEESFWNQVKSFIDTPQGSALISQSKTRKHLAQNLWKQGPLTLRFLMEDELLHMVNLLISEKKWIEESDSKISPFKLTLPVGKESRKTTPLGSNGLSHFFSGAQSNLQEPAAHRVSSGKSRDAVMSDCHKLVDQITRDYPEGFNIGSFRKLFLERFGYAIDHQRLGFDKLVNLLQNMPGMKIESNMIIPAGPSKSQEIAVDRRIDSLLKSSDLAQKDKESDSSWDELGPVHNSVPKKGETGRKEEKVLDYEPLAEDEFVSDSDSGEEESASSNIRSEKQPKSTVMDEDSSLIQILDEHCCGRSKEGNSGKDDKTDIENVKEDSKADTPSSIPWIRTGNALTGVNLMRKQKPGKRISFVTNEPLDTSKDKLIDGIFSSWKKPGEKSTESKLLG